MTRIIMLRTVKIVLELHRPAQSGWWRSRIMPLRVTRALRQKRIFQYKGIIPPLERHFATHESRPILIASFAYFVLNGECANRAPILWCNCEYPRLSFSSPGAKNSDTKEGCLFLLAMWVQTRICLWAPKLMRCKVSLQRRAKRSKASCVVQS